MTTIAYRSGVMACDSQWTSCDTVLSSASKIERLPSGALYGASGHTDDRELRGLLALITDENDLPLASDLEKISSDIQALLILPNGYVCRIMTGDVGEVCPIHDKFAAVGSGQCVAIGAMEFGATAAEAVQVACRRDVYTRGPVHTLELDNGSEGKHITQAARSTQRTAPVKGARLAGDNERKKANAAKRKGRPGQGKGSRG